MIDNTPDRDYMLKDYQKEIKLFEFSQDRKREYLKIRKNLAMNSFHWHFCNGLRFSRSLIFTNKGYHLSWRWALPEKIGPSSKTYRRMNMQHWHYELFHNGYLAIINYINSELNLWFDYSSCQRFMDFKFHWLRNGLNSEPLNWQCHILRILGSGLGNCFLTF